MITQYGREIEDICFEGTFVITDEQGNVISVGQTEHSFQPGPIVIGGPSPGPVSLPAPIRPAAQATFPDISAEVLAAALATSGGGVSGQAITLTNMRLVNVADTGAANAEFSITHNLGYVPKFAILLSTSISGSVYDNSWDSTTTAWTATLAYAKFSAANANTWWGVI